MFFLSKIHFVLKLQPGTITDGSWRKTFGIVSQCNNMSHSVFWFFCQNASFCSLFYCYFIHSLSIYLSLYPSIVSFLLQISGLDKTDPAIQMSSHPTWRWITHHTHQVVTQAEHTETLDDWILLTDWLCSFTKQLNRDQPAQATSCLLMFNTWKQRVIRFLNASLSSLYVRITSRACCPATSHGGPTLADKWQPRCVLVPPAAHEPLGSC